MKLIMHTDQLVLVDKFPNKFFVKYWDDIEKKIYIIVENKKYYLEDIKRRIDNEKNK